MTELTVEHFREIASAIETEVGKVIVGQKDVVRHLRMLRASGMNYGLHMERFLRNG